jgi:hypothetical protein
LGDRRKILTADLVKVNAHNFVEIRIKKARTYNSGGSGVHLMDIIFVLSITDMD